MNSTRTNDRNRTSYIGEALRIYRNDGSNRAYEAVCTHLEPGGIALRTQAVFAVGEVVEFSFAGCERKDQRRQPARVMYRTLDRYGLGLLSGRKPARAEEESARRQEARELLARMKNAYDGLPETHQEAVRAALLDELATPQAAA